MKENRGLAHRTGRYRRERLDDDPRYAEDALYDEAYGPTDPAIEELLAQLGRAQPIGRML